MVLAEYVNDFWYSLTSAQLIEEIVLRRNAIREHRDAVGQFRCWVDDYTIWGFVEGSPPFPEFNKEQFMLRCERFFYNRRSEVRDSNPPGSVRVRHGWDNDLKRMPQLSSLRGKLVKLQWAIARHRDNSLSRQACCDDDRLLYTVLPEKLVADFRLPAKEAFLGYEIYPNGGCPAYWDSHDHCSGRHDFTKPGPCGLHDISLCP